MWTSKTELNLQQVREKSKFVFKVNANIRKHTSIKKHNKRSKYPPLPKMTSDLIFRQNNLIKNPKFGRIILIFPDSPDIPR